MAAMTSKNDGRIASGGAAYVVAEGEEISAGTKRTRGLVASIAPAVFYGGSDPNKKPRRRAPLVTVNGSDDTVPRQPKRTESNSLGAVVVTGASIPEATSVATLTCTNVEEDIVNDVGSSCGDGNISNPTATKASSWSQRLARLTRKISFRPDDGRSDRFPFPTFPRQESSFAAADQLEAAARGRRDVACRHSNGGASSATTTTAQKPAVFAAQRDENGRREYLVSSSYDDFWTRYYAMAPSHRHMYEVVREGVPCKLYFDLEFPRATNPGRDGVAMTSRLVHVVCRALHTRYGLTCTRRDVLELDSSTPKKFSRHLIFQPRGGAVFCNNIAAGHFVRTLPLLLGDDDAPMPGAASAAVAAIEVEGGDGRVVKTKASAPMAVAVPGPSLGVKDKNGTHTSFVDMGVYTRNRNFRLYLSRKLGRLATLTVADSNEFPLPAVGSDGDARARHRAAFFAALLCHLPIACPLLDCEEAPAVAATATAFKKARTDTSGGGQVVPSRADDNGARGGIGGYGNNTKTGYQTSPFPDVDHFILTQLRGGVTGRVRRWVYFPDGQTMIYDISGNRFCERIGRPHRSNGIMFVVNFARGTFYQKCHDPDCRASGFAWCEIPLPYELNPFDAAEAQADADAVRAAEAVEEALEEAAAQAVEEEQAEDEETTRELMEISELVAGGAISSSEGEGE